MSTEKIVLGRYRVLERVGRGAMGVIYRGLDPVLDREVAIKVMLADFASEGADAKRRFFREARAAARLQHRNIVTVFEFAEEDGVPYIVMEFLRGKNLAERIRVDPPLTLEQKLDILGGLCDGLQYASENGVIHRDVKPANVWLLEDGSVKLVDFGIAKMATATTTLGTDVIGSAAYMSPEQAEARAVDGRTDIFSAGVVLYELVAGVRPFEAGTPTATLLKIVQEPPPPITAPDVPASLAGMIGKALEKNPADRYQTAGEFGTALRLVRASLMSGTETLLSNDPMRVLSAAAPPAAGSSAVATASGTVDEVVPPRRHWGRLLLAGTVGGLAIAAALYWANGRLVGTSAGEGPESGAAAGTSEPVKPVPQVSPAPPVSRVLRISSEPAGAAIAVDGADTGQKTPADVSLDAGNPKEIRLSRKGFKTFDGTLTEADVQRGAVTYSLVPEAPALIKVQAAAAYPFEILVANRVVSAMALEHRDVQVQAQQRVRLRAPDVLLDDQVTVDAGRKTISVPELGYVSFSGPREDCRVLHDGKPLATRSGTEPYPPFTSKPIAAGLRTFEFECTDGTRLQPRPVAVKAGETVPVRVQ